MYSLDYLLTTENNSGVREKGLSRYNFIPVVKISIIIMVSKCYHAPPKTTYKQHEASALVCLPQMRILNPIVRKQTQMRDILRNNCRPKPLAMPRSGKVKQDCRTVVEERDKDS